MKSLLVVVNKNNATPSVTKNLLRLSLLWLSFRKRSDLRCNPSVLRASVTAIACLVG